MNRIPRRVSLDADVTVKVRKAPPTVIAGIIGKQKASAWDWENCTIWIDQTLSCQRQWKAYRHELIHASLDIHEAANGGGI